MTYWADPRELIHSTSSPNKYLWSLTDTGLGSADPAVNKTDTLPSLQSSLPGEEEAAHTHKCRNSKGHTDHNTGSEIRSERARGWVEKRDVLGWSTLRMFFEQTPDQEMETDMQRSGKSNPGRRNSGCKGPEVRTCWHVRGTKEHMSHT